MRATLFTAGLVLLAGCAGPSTDDAVVRPGAEATMSGAGWQRLADAPLSPRENSIVAAVGERVVVLGGREPKDCSGQLTCVPPPSLDDGAVYDLTTERWTPIAEVPADVVGAWGGPVVSGDRLYLLGDVPARRLHEYDAGADTWTAFSRPPHAYRGNDTWAATRRFVYLASGDDSAGEGVDRLDLRTGAWTTLPPSQHRPRIQLRTLLPTQGGLVVAGSAVNEAARLRAPIVERLRHGRWRRYDRPSPDVRGRQWMRVGAKVMSPEGWRWHPGASLDLRTGAWDIVPRKPDAAGWSIGHAVGSDRYSADGFTYDGRSGTWLELVPPTEDSYPAMGAWVGDHLFVVDRESRTWWLSSPAG